MNWEAVVQYFRQMQFFPEHISGWELLNSNLPLAVVGAIFTVVFKNDSDRRRETEAKKSITDEGTLDAEALEVGKEKRNFPDAARIIDDLKAKTEARIAKADGRYKRTYDKMTRYDYVALLDAMEQRGLDRKLGELAKEAFNLYRPFKNGRRDVPDDVLNGLREKRKQLDKLGF